MVDEINPRLQCETCGRWYRLYKGGRQWLFPIEPNLSQVCVPCHRKLFNIEVYDD